MPLISAGIGAGVGLLQNQAGAGQRAKQRTLAASTAAYSPWTGMKPQDVAPGGLQPAPSGMSSALQGGAAGMAMGQNMQQSAGAQNLMQSQMNNQNAQAKYYGGGGQ